MIDIEVDLTDEIARLVYSKFPDAYFEGEHVEAPASFPAVSFFEESNEEDESRVDSSDDENAAIVTYSVNIYSNSISKAKQECRDILKIIDDRMRFYNMQRTFARPVNNAADPSIYWMTARYLGVVDKNNVHYRR